MLDDVAVVSRVKHAQRGRSLHRRVAGSHRARDVVAERADLVDALVIVQAAHSVVDDAWVLGHVVGVFNGLCVGLRGPRLGNVKTRDRVWDVWSVSDVYQPLCCVIIKLNRRHLEPRRVGHSGLCAIVVLIYHVRGGLGNLESRLGKDGGVDRAGDVAHELLRLGVDGHRDLDAAGLKQRPASSAAGIAFTAAQKGLVHGCLDLLFIAIVFQQPPHPSPPRGRICHGHNHLFRLHDAWHSTCRVKHFFEGCLVELGERRARLLQRQARLVLDDVAFGHAVPDESWGAYALVQQRGVHGSIPVLAHSVSVAGGRPRVAFVDVHLPAVVADHVPGTVAGLALAAAYQLVGDGI